jgi:DNA-binding PadR family transcriptional regulator
MTIGSAGTGAAGASDATLTSAQFHILLTLAEGHRHGYGIMKEIERRTHGEVELGPGTLYRSLKQLLDRGLIEEAARAPDGRGDGSRERRFYALTPVGKVRTAEEAQRLRALVQWAREALVLGGGQG